MRGKNGIVSESKCRVAVLLGMAAMLASCRTASIAPNAMLRREPLPVGRNLEKAPGQTQARFAFGGTARVQAVRNGKAEYQTGTGAWRALHVGTVLSSGDQVRTGPKATVDVWLKESFSLVRLQPGTTLVLETLRYGQVDHRKVPQTVLRLERGLIHVGLRPQVPGAIYEIRTPKAVYRALASQDPAEIQTTAEGNLRTLAEMLETLQHTRGFEVTTGGVVTLHDQPW